MPNIDVRSVAKAAIELQKRRMDALSLYRVTPKQEEVLKSSRDVRSFLLKGGNRCSRAGTLLWKLPAVEKTGKGIRCKDARPVPIESLEVGDKVVGFHAGQRMDLRSATITEKKEFEETGFVVTTKWGYQATYTHDHPVWCCPPSHDFDSVDVWEGRSPHGASNQGEWRLVRDIPEGWYIRMSFGGYKDELPATADDDAYFHGLMDGDGCVSSSYGIACYSSHLSEHELRQWVESHLRSRGVNGSVRHELRSENGVQTTWCNKQWKSEYLSDREWVDSPSASQMCSYIQGLMDADGHVSNDGKVVLVQKDLQRLHMVQQWLLMFGVKSSLMINPPNLSHKRPNQIGRLQISGTSLNYYSKHIGFRHFEKHAKLQGFVSRKTFQGKMWWARVRSIQKTDRPVKFVGVTTSRETYVSNGMLSHNSGKSHTAAVRFASIVRNKPLITMDGREIHCRADHQKGRDLLCWLVGLQLDHIGQTLHRLLFRPGMFDIVKDPQTGLWRAWHPPMYPDDFNIPMSERKPGPPLIPPSEVEDWSWEKKAEKQFSMCKLKNGTEIYAFASSAPVKAGDPVDEIWIDEEIKFATHYAEWQARLVDRSGRLFWSSWPSTSNAALRRLNKQCDTEAREVETGVREYPTAAKSTLKMSENPFFTKKQVEDTLSGYTEAERRARDLGEFTTDLIKFYNEFDEDIHCADYDNESMDDRLSRVLRDNNWTPPRDWARDLVLDPGTAHPAVLLVAIPPPEFWEDGEPYYVPYREIYGARMTADDMARKVRGTEQGYMFERFIIDGQAARQTPMGHAGTIGQHYSECFARMNLSSRQFPGSGFMVGDPNIPARAMAVRQLMRIRPTGRPRLRIVRRNCPNLVEQLRETTRKLLKEEAQEVPEAGQPMDVMVCLEYYASRYPSYEFPASLPPAKSPADLSLEAEQKMFGSSQNSEQPIYFGAA